MHKTTYPHKICASALLLDGKLQGWKAGGTHWASSHDARTWLKADRADEYTVERTEWTANNEDERREVFERKVHDWLRQWDAGKAVEG